MAAKMGVTQPTWSRVENGAIVLSVEQLAKAARVLGVAPGVVLEHADHVVSGARKRGVQVEMERVKNPIDIGLLLIGAAAVTALVALILDSNKK